MSYILDALRKSERQRRLGNIPSLESEPRTVSRPRALFKWLAAGGALSAAVIAGGWWILQWDSTTAQYGTTLAERVSRAFTALGVAPAEPHTEPRAASARTLTPAPSRSPAAAPTPEPETGREPPSSPQPAVARAAAGPALPATRPPAETPPAPETPTAATPYARLDPELRAQLPPLTVNAVSFSEDAGRRFVMINETIYREGQDVAGVTISQILRDGVVLSYRGREFLLPR